MKKLSIYIILLALIGCSVSQKVTEKKSEDIGVVFSDSLNKSNKAKDAFIKGNVSEMKGNIAESIIEYQEALSFEGSPGIHYALAKAYFKLNKFPKALEHARSAVLKDSSNTDYLLLLANVYSSARLTDSSASTYEKIIKIDSTNYQAYFELGLLYEAQKPRTALSIYEKLLNQTGPEWNVLLRIAELNERLGNIASTITTVEDLLELDPSNIQLQKLLIDAYIKSKEYDKALQYINDGLTIFPDDITLTEYKAKIFIEKKDWAAGTREYSKLINDSRVPYNSKISIATAFMNETMNDSTLIPLVKNLLIDIKKDSSDWQLNAFLAELTLRENDDSTALDYFIEAANQAEWNSQLIERLGILLFERQKYEMAIEKMSKAVEKFPDSFVINIILGLSLAQTEHHKDAEPVLKKAVELKGDDLTALHALGYTLNQLDRKQEAIKYLDRALIIDSENVQIIGTLGLIYESMENYPVSDSLYNKALSIDSTDALILNNYAYSLAERDTDLDKALSMSKSALQKDPESPSYLDTIGWIYYKLGEYKEAVIHVTKAVEKDKDNATLVDHLADIYLKLGDKGKAVELWQKALELDGSREKIKQKLAQE